VTRVGAVDCGTNSIRLLVADVDPGTGALTDVLRRMEVVRLGHGVDRTGRIDPEAMRRTLAMAAEYAQQCRELEATAVRFVATSASRDADNADEFVAGVREAFAHYGIAPEVVSGDEEAALSFRGATGDLRAAGIPGPYLVVDLGGGSTELVRGESTVEAARSVDVGCVRMTERHLHSDPPSDEELGAATRDVDAALDLAAERVPLEGIATLVGLAGSVTTVTAHALHLSAYDPARIHLAELAPEQVVTACESLLHLPRAERAALGFMHPGRVDVIGAGALVWHQVVGRLAGLGVERVVASEHDILDGIALSVAAAKRPAA
jgi:exopolyphosphatase / guanosine-5'-triphosphate,3'-diphosphate pyrophosphatase